MAIKFFKKKNKNNDRIQLIKEKTSKRINSFRKNLPKKNADDNSIQLFHLVRQFFADMFRIRYEFTFEELDDELSKKRISNDLKDKITIFLKKTSAVEYSDEKLSKNELKGLFDDFLKFFRRLTSNGEKKDRQGFKRFFGFLIISKRKKEEPKAKQENKKPSPKKGNLLSGLGINLGKSNIEQIHEMLINALDMVNKNNIKDSRKLYVKIKRKYDSLNEDEKKEVYDDIIILYREIVSEEIR